MAYAWAVVVAGLAGTIATTCVMLFRGAGAANLGRPGAVRVAAIFGTVWTAWVLASASLASGGVYQFAPGKVEPWLALAMVVPLIALLLATRIPVVSRTLDQPNTQLWLTVAQIFRVEGAAFLIVMALGALFHHYTRALRDVIRRYSPQTLLYRFLVGDIMIAT